MARSNSANAPSICVINRPGAVVMSIASVSDRKPAPAAVIDGEGLNYEDTYDDPTREPEPGEFIDDETVEDDD